MGACLDTFSDELCQVNTHVGRISQWQARLNSFIASPSPSPKAWVDEDGEDSDDGDDVDASSYSDDEMTVSRWLTLCHLWQKVEVILG